MHLRSTLPTTLDSGRLLGLSCAVVTGELLVRAVLGSAFSSLWLVAWPPVIAAVAFGLGAASVHSVPDAFGDRVRQQGAVVLVAIVGHAVALVAGAALFFAIDTPLRAFVYWVGLDPMAWSFAYLALPLVGLALCTAIVWVVPATIIADIARGTTTKTAVRQTLGGIVSQRSFFDRLAFIYMTVVACMVVGMVASACLLIAIDVFPLSVSQFEGYEITTASLTLYYVVAIVLAAALAAVPLTLGARLTQNGASRLDSIEHPKATADGGVDGYRPVFTLVVVVLLVVSLVTVFGGIRMAELRPVEDPEPESLTDHHRVIVLDALDNLRSHSYVVYKHDLQETPVKEKPVAGIDPQTRELLLGELYRSYWDDDPLYVWVGHAVVGQRSVSLSEALLGDQPDDERTSVPGNQLEEFKTTKDVFPHIFPYHHRQSADNATVDYEDEVVRVRTTDAELVVSEVAGLSLDDVEITEGWLEVLIDRDSKTPREFEYRYEVQYDNGETETEHVRYEIDLGASVQRPEGAQPSLEERVWRALLY